MKKQLFIKSGAGTYQNDNFGNQVINGMITTYDGRKYFWVELVNKSGIDQENIKVFVVTEK